MTCPHTWPLDDPNPEDQALGRAHRCGHPEGHTVPHRCACGAHPDPFAVALAAAIDPEDPPCPAPCT
jgi:hypothetical protein